MENKRNWTPIKEYTDIKFEFFEGIARIMINRLDVYKAFRRLTHLEMLDARSICTDRTDIGVFVVTCVGDMALCSGGALDDSGDG